MLTLIFSKSTKNMHVYVDTSIDAAIPHLYVDKKALPTPAPTEIYVELSCAAVKVAP